MLKKLKQKVLDANLALREYGLAPFTWGNASQADADRKYMVIKPSGVRYEDMSLEDMCVVCIEDGSMVEGDLNPSTDTPTHLELYRHFSPIFGIAHTHSPYATAFAQAGMAIPCYGTTHADYFYGEIPCARALRPHEIRGDYEVNTGGVIIKTFQERSIDPLSTPGALVCSHGPFAWGATAAGAAANAAYLEETARLAYMTLQLSPEAAPVPQALLEKHYGRKHGDGAYYGQTPAK
ncbi:MAG: L-ribulose-5-phosphate 4-epimerase AraD [Oscillospiraceae bacterium]|nr:L-ribulose-5-phosphate 4-epimerase AraD [Oscillospiraceae bacterium]